MKIRKIVFMIFFIAVCFIEASCNKNKVTVTFDSNGGILKNCEAQYVIEKGNNINQPDDPIREGYEFKGWYNSDLEWIFIAYGIFENTTLTAKWEKIPYYINISYTDNSCENVSLEYGFDEDLPVEEITAKYIKGFYSAEEINLPKRMPSHDIDINLQCPLTISYDGCEGFITGVNENVPSEYRKEVFIRKNYKINNRYNYLVWKSMYFPSEVTSIEFEEGFTELPDDYIDITSSLEHLYLPTTLCYISPYISQVLMTKCPQVFTIFNSTQMYLGTRDNPYYYLICDTSCIRGEMTEIPKLHPECKGILGEALTYFKDTTKTIPDGIENVTTNIWNYNNSNEKLIKILIPTSAKNLQIRLDINYDNSIVYQGTIEELKKVNVFCESYQSCYAVIICSDGYANFYGTNKIEYYLNE